MKWYIDVIKNKYLKFDGRAGRPEYWFFILFNIIAYVVMIIIDRVIGIYPALTAIYALAVLLPSIAVCIRRFHDQDRSGWFILLGLIPVVGGIILLVFMVLPGTQGSNRFGAEAPTSPSA